MTTKENRAKQFVEKWLNMPYDNAVGYFGETNIKNLVYFYVSAATDQEKITKGELDSTYSLAMQGMMNEYDRKFTDTANENYSLGYDRAVELAKDLLVDLLDADAMRKFESDMEGLKYEE